MTEKTATRYPCAGCDKYPAQWSVTIVYGWIRDQTSVVKLYCHSCIAYVDHHHKRELLPKDVRGPALLEWEEP